MSRPLAVDARVALAVDADIRAIAGIVAETWRATYAPLVGAAAVGRMVHALLSHDALLSLAHQRDIDMPVAFVGDSMAGTALARHGHDGLHILRLYVLPRFQGQGVGQALLDWLALRQPPESGIRLEVAAGNERALRFYLRAGFLDRGGGSETIAGARFEVRRLERPGFSTA